MANEEGKPNPRQESSPKSQEELSLAGQEKLWSKLVAQAWADEQFKQRLVNEPAAVFREHGMQVPAGVDIRVVEPTEKLWYLILPPKPDATELTASQLTGVAGGTCRSEIPPGSFCDCGRCFDCVVLCSKNHCVRTCIKICPY